MCYNTYMKHSDFMQIAIEEARIAAQQGDIPVGALIVIGDKIIARAHNQRETSRDATAHAEVLAIRQACQKIKNWRLKDATIYVTLEPCPMCAGAIVNAHVKRLVFGAPNNMAGGAGSLFNITHNANLNHQVEVIGGVMEQECSTLLKNFTFTNGTSPRG